MTKKISVFCLFSLLFLLIWSVFLLHQDAKLYDEVVRFHVLANSDSEEDQAIKLAVRDHVVSLVDTLVKDCESQQQALAILQENRDLIQTQAQAVVSSLGKEDSVSVEFGREQYPTRYYEGMQFPAGSYESVRILIGEGAGQNWWCVLFPPLCADAANAKETLVDSGFTQSQIHILTESDNPRYVLRFKALEAWEALRQQFRKEA